MRFFFEGKLLLKRLHENMLTASFKQILTGIISKIPGIWTVDGCPSKENLFGQSLFLMNVTLFFPLVIYSINLWNDHCVWN